MRLLLALLLTGCAATDGWYREFDFTMQRLEWNHITGPNAYQRMVNLCGDAPVLMGCAFRIKEGGQCVVFSIYSQEQARLVRTKAGVSLEADELGHCGVFDGVVTGSAWGHK
jgi:hypothetical protein